MNACPPHAMLQKLLANELATEEEAAVSIHVESCGRCQQRLENITAIQRPVEPDEDNLASTQQKARPAHPLSGIRQAFGSRSHRPSLGDAALIQLGSLFLTSDTAKAVSKRENNYPSELEWPVLPGYEILGVLGRGGMGVVYKARHLRLRRLVALKMVPVGAANKPEAYSRFLAEGEAIARLQHPNVVQIYEIGFHREQPYFALELVEGGTLAEKLEGKPLPIEEAARLIADIALAVDVAHQRGIIHRDLKPANVLLTVDGVPKISDFGLAKTIDVDLKLTQSGAVVGTPAYMAPEQARGANAEIGPFTDVYALGVILYEALIGRPPFLAESYHEILDQVITQDPVSPRSLRPGLPLDLQTITLKCLEKEIWRRYASARELSDDLQRFLKQEPIAARPLSALGRWKRFARRNKTLVGGVSGIVAALLMGTVVSILFAIGEAQQRKTAETNKEIADENTRKADSARTLALGQAYRARLAAGLVALGERDFAEAAQHLDAAPESFHGWEWKHLHQRLLDERPSVRPIGTKFGRFQGLFSFRQRMLALMMHEDHFVAIDTQTDEVVWELPAGTLASAAPTTDRTLMLVYQQGAPLALVDESGQPRYSRESMKAKYARIVMSPTGTQFAAVLDLPGRDSTVELRDIPSGELRRVLPPISGYAVPLFSPDGQQLAVACGDHNVRLWPVASDGPPLVLPGRKVWIRGIAYHPNGQSLLAFCHDGALRQWRIANGEVIDDRFGHESPVHSAAYSPNGEWIVSGGDDRTMRVWRVSGHDALAIVPGHRESISVIAFHPDGKTVVSISSDRSIRFWQSLLQSDAHVLRKHTSYVYPVAFSPDGRWFASGGWDNVVRLWDAATGNEIAVLQGPTKFVASLTPTSDGRRLVCRSNDSRMRIWDTETGELVSDWQDDGPLSYRPENAAISADGKLIATGVGNRVKFRELTTGRELPELSIQVEGQVRLVAIRPDGRQMAIAAKSVSVVDLDGANHADCSTLQDLGTSLGGTQTIAFSQNGRHLVTASDDLSVRLWNTATRELERVMTGHTEQIFAAVFSPDGTRLATAGRDRGIHLWDTATGDEMTRLRGHSDYVYSLAFSPDGSVLISGSGDRTVRMWDTVPLSKRHEASQELERVRPEAKQLVEQLFHELREPNKVIRQVNADSMLDDILKRAAWHEVLRRGATAHKSGIGN